MDKQVLLVLIALLAAGWLFSLNIDNHDEYLEWKARFGYQWSGKEDVYRRIIFMKNIEIMEVHNRDTTQTYKMGINQFTALTDEEFQTIYLTPKDLTGIVSDPATTNRVGEDIDWEAKGIVTPIKNQGQCGSCWAFSAIAVTESFAKQVRKQTVNLSEQQLVDCSRKYGNKGCQGGFNYQGLAYVKDHGVTDTATYPYRAKNGNCEHDGGSFKISKVLTARGCSGIASAIQSRVIGVSADATNWSRYQSGIFNNCKKSLNHDITLVGYNSQYYRIKNSWGSSWGEKGFIRLAPGNTCGVCDDKSPWVE